MRNLRDRLNRLTTLIGLYRFEEALDEFYDDEIVTHENENPPTVGLAAYKQRARAAFYEHVSNYSALLLDTIIAGDVTACLWHYKFDHELWGRWDKLQLSVQRWKNGKITVERHYYS